MNGFGPPDDEECHCGPYTSCSCGRGHVFKEKPPHPDDDLQVDEHDAERLFRREISIEELGNELRARAGRPVSGPTLTGDVAAFGALMQRGGQTAAGMTQLLMAAFLAHKRRSDSERFLASAVVRKVERDFGLRPTVSALVARLVWRGED